MQNQNIVVNSKLNNRRLAMKQELERMVQFAPEWEAYKLSTWGSRLVVNEQGHVVRESGWYMIPMVGALNAAQAAMPWPYEEPFVEHPDFVNDNKKIFSFDGEGFDGMAQHISGKREYDVRYDEDGITHHVYESGLTQLERLMFESADIAFVEGEVLKAHDNVVSTPYFLRASWIQKQVSCTSTAAEALAESFKEIGATEKMVKTFIVWLQKKGVEAGLTYFATMAEELKKVTAVVDDIMDLGCQNVDEYEADDTESAPDTQRFHLLDREDWEATPWFWKQSKRFKEFIYRLREADKDELKKIGKSMFEKKPFKGQQLQVAWAEYKIRKAQLYPTTKLGAQLMAKRMNGRQLWNAIQANLDKLTKQDIRLLWDDFKARTADRDLRDIQPHWQDVVTIGMSEEEYAQYQAECDEMDAMWAE